LSTDTITRKEIIDTKLKAAGRDVTDSAKVTQEYGIQLDPKATVQEPIVSYNGLEFCDYILLGREGKPLAVIEEKKPLKILQLGESRQSNIATILLRQGGIYHSAFILYLKNR
jgi:type I restriction enzyme R subunit